MQQDKFPTKVKFRKFNDDGGVIALFPEQDHKSGNANPGCIMSYMHIGQHGEATEVLLTSDELVDATPGEYADLLRELKMIGYLPEVI
jgi:hypothetical protein